jgi:ABC-type arginine transport system ATPase subunit
MTDLTERYRGPSRATRVVALVVVAALALTGAGLLGWSVVFQSTPAVTSQLVSFEIEDEHTSVATIVVARESSFTEATCQVVAVAEDHAVVATRDIPVLDGPEKQTLRVELRTERRPTTVDLLGCTTPDQPPRR